MRVQILPAAPLPGSVKVVAELLDLLAQSRQLASGFAVGGSGRWLDGGRPVGSRRLDGLLGLPDGLKTAAHGDQAGKARRDGGGTPTPIGSVRRSHPPGGRKDGKVAFLLQTPAHPRQLQ